MLVKNNYPVSLIKKIINKTISARVVPKQNEPFTFCKLPYISNLSERIQTIFKDQVTKRGEKVKIAMKSQNTVKNCFYSKTKSSTEKLNKSNVVYNIPCSQCNKCYIGQTGRYLKTRLREHKNDQKNYLLRSNPTALVEHKIETGHDFEYDNTTILQTQSNYKKRLIAEMIEIQKNKNCVNKRTDIEHLSNAYFNILATIK